MTLRALASLSVLLALPTVAPAQQHHPGYAEGRSAQVKTLGQAEVDELLAGTGMGLARPAEMNGFPGPRHVLDLADSLSLTPEQRASVQGIFERMQARAATLGRAVVAAEGALDSLFAGGGAVDPALAERVEAVEALRAELRIVHLRAHVETKALLTMHQVHAYDRLRGYRDQPPPASWSSPSRSW